MEEELISSYQMSVVLTKPVNMFIPHLQFNKRSIAEERGELPAHRVPLLLSSSSSSSKGLQLVKLQQLPCTFMSFCVVVVVNGSMDYYEHINVRSKTFMSPLV